jgi:hypothetical protein
VTSAASLHIHLYRCCTGQQQQLPYSTIIGDLIDIHVG